MRGLTASRKLPPAIAFYNRFIGNVLARLKVKWPALDFFASLSKAFDVPWQDMDLAHFAAFDLHACSFTTATSAWKPDISETFTRMSMTCLARCFDKL